MGSIRRRVGRTGAVSWQVTVDLGPDPATGKRRQRSKSARTYARARSLRAAWEAEIAGGVAEGRGDRGARDGRGMTVADLCALWLSSREERGARASSLRLWRATLSRHVLPALGREDAADLPPRRIDRHLEALRAGGVGSRTVQSCHDLLRRAYRWGVRSGLVPRDPMERADRPAHRPEVPVPWSLEEARSFLAAVRGTAHGAIFETLLGTGLRRGEVLALRRADVDLDPDGSGGFIRVRRAVMDLRERVVIGETKTRRSRRDVAIGPELARALAAHREIVARVHAKDRRFDPATDLLFPSRAGTTIRPANLNRAYDLAIDQSGVRRIRLHDLRHTHASLLLQAGVPVADVAERLGHASPQVTLSIYAHALPGAAGRVGRLADSLLFGSTTGRPGDAM